MWRKVCQFGAAIEYLGDAAFLVLFLFGGAYLVLFTDQQITGWVFFAIGLAVVWAFLFRKQIRAWWSRQKA
jgi:hypothetical protein